MRKISLWFFIFVFTVSLARAQDAATQQQLDKLSGQIQDILTTQETQNKRLDALEKQISDLSDKLNQPAAAGDNASADDLKKLAAQVQEIDKKRQADNELILKQIEKLGKTGGSTGHKSSAPAESPSSTDTSTSAADGTQKGYDYVIAAGDTISAIAKAYRAQGVKVTSAQILAANPGLNANSLIVGKKIFIPDPNAK
jgi:septal ring factor EnvC (AmiA/AmiB activator)/phage tail protein X